VGFVPAKKKKKEHAERKEQKREKKKFCAGVEREKAKTYDAGQKWIIALQNTHTHTTRTRARTRNHKKLKNGLVIIIIINIMGHVVAFSANAQMVLSSKRGGYNGTALASRSSSSGSNNNKNKLGGGNTRRRLGLKSRITTRASVEEAEEVELDCMDRMEKAMEVMTDNFSTVRTGRANPNMLDRIEVDYYGAMTPLKSLSNTNNLDAQTLVIQPFDKGALKEIEKAIVRSDLGITPSNDGSVIRLVVPPLTAERRKELTKQVSKLGEEGKVALRNVRRDAMTKIKKMKTDKTLGEDEFASFEKKIEDLTTSYVKKTEDAVKAKEKELTTV
jgi:ribosome recycling factor